MHDAPAPDPSGLALVARERGGWRGWDRDALDARVREYADGLLEAGCRPGESFALEACRSSEAVPLALAARRAGLVVRLGRAEAPFAAALAPDPARAAELATLAGVDPLRVPVPGAADTGTSLERLAAHGVLRAAVRPAPPELEGDAGAPAVATASGALLLAGELLAGRRSLREVGDLLRADETLLIGVPLDRPWLVALVLAALDAGAAVAVGAPEDALALGSDVAVVPREAAEAQARDQMGTGRRARARSLRAQRGAAAVSPLAGLARRWGRVRDARPPRCLVVADGMVERDLCTDLHVAGTAVLHTATDDRAAVPVLLNRPHRFRFDALGLPAPDHACAIDDGRVELRGPAVAGGRVRTDVSARTGPDGFLLPAAP